MPRLSRLSRGGLVALGLVVAATSTACHPNASFTTRSYYVGSASLDKARLLGCGNGDKQGRMTLFFGAPAAVGTGYGATLWGAQNQSVGQISNLTKEVARGYAWCRRSSSYRLLIGVGTSNSGIDSKANAWLEAHGQQWSIMVEALAAWANRYYPDAVAVYGAWDAEPSWSTPAKAHAWIHGYDQGNPGRRALFVNGSADGCPDGSATNGACNNGWRQIDVWHLAWQHDPSLPIPQIYANSGINARQWQQIDEYGTHVQSDGVYYFGVMSQAGACQQVGGCVGTTNAPHAAFDQLLGALNSHIHTRQPYLETMTDIRWHS